MRQHATAHAVIQLFNPVAMAVANVGIAIATAIVQRGITGAPAAAFAAAGIARLHVVAEVVILQQRAVKPGEVAHPTVEIVGHAVAGARLSPGGLAVRAQPVAERNVDVHRQHLVTTILPGVFGQAIAQRPVDIVNGGI